MAYSGAWRNAATTHDRAPALGDPELSGRHTAGYRTSGSRIPPTSSRLDETPVEMTSDGAVEGGRYQPPGGPNDNSPETHDAGEKAPSRQYPDAARMAAGRLHEVNRGSVLARTYELAMMRQADDKHDTVRLEVAPIGGQSRTALIRGAYSYPEDNPDGFRYGYRIQQFVDRRMQGRHRWAYGTRPLQILTPAFAQDAPAPLQDESSRFMSPFGSLDRARSRVAAIPVARRTPNNWDDDVITDGTAGVDAADIYPRGW